MWDQRDSKLFVHHKSEDSHLGGASLVELDGTLLQLCGLVKLVPSEINVIVAEVANEFPSGDVLHYSQLKDSDETDDLSQTGARHGRKGSPTVRDIRESVTRDVNVSRKANSVLLDKVSKNGKHGDTSVLEFDETKTVELSLVTISNKAKRIVESEWRLSAECTFERSNSNLLGNFLRGGFLGNFLAYNFFGSG